MRSLPPRCPGRPQWHASCGPLTPPAPRAPPSLPARSFAWRDKCNRCGKSKGDAGGAPPSGGYDAGAGYGGGGGGYDAGSAYGGSARQDPPRAAPQGPPGERRGGMLSAFWREKSLHRSAASAGEPPPLTLPLPRPPPMHACRQVCARRLDVHGVRQCQLAAPHLLQPVQRAQARHG